MSIFTIINLTLLSVYILLIAEHNLGGRPYLFNISTISLWLEVSNALTRSANITNIGKLWLYRRCNIVLILNLPSWHPTPKYTTGHTLPLGWPSFCLLACYTSRNIDYPFIGDHPLTWVNGHSEAADSGWVEGMTPWNVAAEWLHRKVPVIPGTNLWQVIHPD